jgi:hypothetical protein
MIRLLASLVLLCAMHGDAAEKKAPAKTATKKAQAKPAAQPAPLSIPAEAREVEPGTYLHVDAEGKRWKYRRTPFGVSRWEDKDAQADRADERAEAAQIEATTAVEDGDLIHFSRPGPFGAYKWSRKKSELDAGEQAVWKRQQERAAKAEDGSRSKD